MPQFEGFHPRPHAATAAQGDAILVAESSPEGEMIAAALRAKGFSVCEAPLSLLGARMVAEAPRALVVDVDVPGAVEAVERLRDLTYCPPSELFCVGDPVRAAELGATPASGRAFERPIDVAALIAALATVAEPSPPELQPRTARAPSRRPLSLPRDGRSDVPPVLTSDAERLHAASIFPRFDEAMGTVRISPAYLSPELAQLLEAAERRVEGPGLSAFAGVLSPDAEIDLLLPPELLATLDDPLDPEDEAAGTGPGGGTGAPLAPWRPNTIPGSHTSASVTGHDLVVGGSGPRPSSSGAGAGAEAASLSGSAGAPPTMGSHAVASAGSFMRADASEGRPPPSAAASSREPVGTSKPFTAPTTAVSEAELLGAPPSPPVDTREPYADGGHGFATDPGRTGSFPPLADAAGPIVFSTFDAGRAVYPDVARLLAAATDPGRSLPPGALSPPVVPAFPFRAESPARLSFSIGPQAASLFNAAFPSGPHASTAAAFTRPQGVSTVSLAPQHLAGRYATIAAPAAREAMPAVLGEGDAVRVLARAVAARASGSLALGPESAIRRIVLREGDIVTCGSSAPDETLVAFLAARGDLERDAVIRLAGKLPPFGRHAGAALIAHGHLGQDDLWPVLRAHAEWVIGRAIVETTGGCELESEPPGRLKAEPNVFGGATGAEVLVEAVRRVVPADVALRRLGGPLARLDDGPSRTLLGECALRREDEERVKVAAGRTVGDVIAGAEPELIDVLYALVSLGVLDALAPAVPPEAAAPTEDDPLDEEAIRRRVRARVALVEDADYFTLIGVAHTATAYEVRRAYLDLRRAFEPSRVLTAATADLADDVRLIVEVLDEAYEILREPHRRERYRRAIEAASPS